MQNLWIFILYQFWLLQLFSVYTYVLFSTKVFYNQNHMVFLKMKSKRVNHTYYSCASYGNYLSIVYLRIQVHVAE